jgi:hypothetical protein
MKRTSKDCEEILVTIDPYWGSGLWDITLEQWIEWGPDRPFNSPRGFKCKDGRKLPWNAVPLQYHNSRFSRFLIKMGILENPWKKWDEYYL